MQQSKPIKLCVIGDGNTIHVQIRTQVFVERGYNVTLVSETPIELPRVKTILVEGLSSISPLNSMTRIIHHIQIARGIDADIYHIHYAGHTGAWALPIANVHPYVVSTMGGDILFEERNTLSPYTRYLTERVLEHADLITVKSNYIRDKLIKNFPSEKMMRVIWGISLEKFHPVDASQLREKLNLASDDIVLLSPKILKAFYNIHLIIDTLPILLARYPKIKLVITEYRADPSYRQQLDQQIQALGVESSVRFVGSIPNNELNMYYSLSDLVITIPPSDGFPQTSLEAMACHTPNVLGNLPNYDEFLTHKLNAYFVDFTPDSLAAGIFELLDDSSLYQTIVDNGKALVTDIGNLEREADRVEAVYRTLIAQYQPSQKKSLRYGEIGSLIYYGLKRAWQKVWS